MNILHYSLGFPPYRTGGMTKFCTDLMKRQTDLGNKVGLLWPGQIKIFSNKTKIIRRENFEKIENYEIINPLPVPLNGGISNIDAYTKECKSVEVYKKFLMAFKPDAIHIHTLMGLHQEFLQIAKEMEIKIVYTTHDYFGICPKISMFRNGKNCNSIEDCEKCSKCNGKALSKKKIILLQSPIYRKLKNNTIVKKIRNKYRKKFFKEEDIEIENNQLNANDYKRLRQYYMKIFSKIDIIHYNSTVAKKQFEKYLENKGAVIPVSHNNIGDNRKIRTYSDTLRLGYLSLAVESKGFDMLIEAMDHIVSEKKNNISLTIYGKCTIKRQYLIQKEKYQYTELKDVFDNIDCLIMPSIWYETFGLVVLEALSYGVPVIVTKNVGAKDLLQGEFGLVIEPTKEAIEEAILKMKDINERKILNYNIVNKFEIDKYMNINEQIEKLYYM